MRVGSSQVAEPTSGSVSYVKAASTSSRVQAWVNGGRSRFLYWALPAAVFGRHGSEKDRKVAGLDYFDAAPLDVFGDVRR